MATVETTTRFTPDDLLRLPDGKCFELVDGQLVEKNVSVLSSLVGGNVLAAIWQFVRAEHLGHVGGPDLGLQCYPDDPEKIRRPDVAFVCQNRISDRILQDSYLRIAPDLVVEVISPNDVAYELERKIQEYLSAGVQLIWIVYPEQRTVRIHRGDGTIGWLTETGVLDGEDVIPGFRVPVRELFPGIAESPAPADAN